MTREIRRRHLITWLVLAIVLPLLMAAGIAFRHPEPVNTAVPQTPAAAERRQNAPAADVSSRQE